MLVRSESRDSSHRGSLTDYLFMLVIVVPVTFIIMVTMGTRAWATSRLGFCSSLTSNYIIVPALNKIIVGPSRMSMRWFGFSHARYAYMVFPGAETRFIGRFGANPKLRDLVEGWPKSRVSGVVMARVIYSRRTLQLVESEKAKFHSLQSLLDTYGGNVRVGYSAHSMQLGFEMLVLVLLLLKIIHTVWVSMLRKSLMHYLFSKGSCYLLLFRVCHKKDVYALLGNYPTVEQITCKWTELYGPSRRAKGVAAVKIGRYVHVYNESKGYLSQNELRAIAGGNEVRVGHNTSPYSLGTTVIYVRAIPVLFSLLTTVSLWLWIISVASAAKRVADGDWDDIVVLRVLATTIILVVMLVLTQSAGCKTEIQRSSEDNERKLTYYSERRVADCVIHHCVGYIAKGDHVDNADNVPYHEDVGRMMTGLPFSVTKIYTPKTIKVTPNMSISQREWLSSRCDGLKFEAEDKMKSPHETNAAIRSAARELVARKIKSGKVVLHVGENPRCEQFQGPGHYFCKPTLDAKDAARNANQADVVTHDLVNCTNDTRATLQEFPGKADVIVSVHSHYNIKPEVLFCEAEARGVEDVWIVTQLSAGMLMDDNGILPYAQMRYSTTGGRMKFDFVGQSDEIFEHDAATVREYMRLRLVKLDNDVQYRGTVEHTLPDCVVMSFRRVQNEREYRPNDYIRIHDTSGNQMIRMPIMSKALLSQFVFPSVEMVMIPKAVRDMLSALNSRQTVGTGMLSQTVRNLLSSDRNAVKMDPITRGFLDDLRTDHDDIIKSIIRLTEVEDGEESVEVSLGYILKTCINPLVNFIGTDVSDIEMNKMLAENTRYYVTDALVTPLTLTITGDRELLDEDNVPEPRVIVHLRGVANRLINDGHNLVARLVLILVALFVNLHAIYNNAVDVIYGAQRVVRIVLGGQRIVQNPRGMLDGWNFVQPETVERAVRKGDVIGGPTDQANGKPLVDLKGYTGLPTSLGTEIEVQDNSLVNALYANPYATALKEDMVDTGEVSMLSEEQENELVELAEEKFEMCVIQGDWYMLVNCDSESEATVVLLRKGGVLYRVRKSSKFSTIIKTKHRFNTMDIRKFFEMCELQPQSISSVECLYRVLDLELRYEIPNQELRQKEKDEFYINYRTSPKTFVNAVANADVNGNIVEDNAGQFRVCIITPGSIYTNCNEVLLEANVQDHVRVALVIDGHAFQISHDQARDYVEEHPDLVTNLIRWNIRCDGVMRSSDNLINISNIMARLRKKEHMVNPRHAAIINAVIYNAQVHYNLLARINMIMKTTTDRVKGYMRALTDVQVYDTALKAWLTKPCKRSYCCRNESLMKVKYNKMGIPSTTGRGRYLIFSEEIDFLRSKRLVELYINNEDMFNNYLYDSLVITLEDGVPGCGKTQSIVDSAKPKDLVCATTVAARDELKSRMPYHDSIRTYDSVLLNDVEHHMVLHADEALMAHAGEILAVAVKSNAKLIVARGDSKQVPFINRCYGATLRNYKLQHYSDETMPKNVTHRLSKCATINLTQIYENIETTSQVTGNDTVVRIRSVINPLGKCDATITFTQYEKQTLEKLGHNNVYTAHEVEGKTFNDVVVIRFVPQDNPLYQSQPHVIVAASRHKKSLTYYTIDTADALSCLIRKEKVTDWREDEAKTKIKAVEIKPVMLLDWELRAFGDIEEVNERTELMDEVATCAGNITSSQMNIYSWRPRTIDVLPKSNAVAVSTECIQLWLAKAFDTKPRWYTEAERATQPDISHPDLTIHIGKFIKAGVSKYESCSPVLYTPQPVRSGGTNVELMNSLRKRNIDPPNLAVMRNSEFIEDVVEHFFKTYVDEERMKKAKEIVVKGNTNVTDRWTRKRTSTQKQALRSVMTNAMSKNPRKYACHLKADYKPKLDNSHLDMPAGQIIAAHHPAITAKHTTTVKTCDQILKNSLKDNWLMNEEVTAEQRDGHLNNLLRGKKSVKFQEIDFSKFDKSQEEMCLRIELAIMKRLGAEPDFLDEWFECHISSELVDHKRGITLRVNGQRKSGDCMTFMGNTLITMAVLSYTYNLNTAIGGIFGGDDSLIMYHGEEPMIDQTGNIAKLFNLTAKIENYPEAVAFASKLLIHDGLYYKLIPDPLKVLVRLGRHDIHCKEHLDYFHTSMVDSLHMYNIENVRVEVAKVAAKRHNKFLNCDMNFGIVVDFIHNLLEDKTKLYGLYEAERRIWDRPLSLTVKETYVKERALLGLEELQDIELS